MSPAEARLAEAKFESEQARRRLVSTASALQYRLRPAILASNAWDGVREKSGELAGDAIQAVKERPVKASGILAGIALFLARHSIKSLVTGLLSGGDEDEADDPPAPAAERAKSKKQGVKA